jgi:hypothetical protein
MLHLTRHTHLFGCLVTVRCSLLVPVSSPSSNPLWDSSLKPRMPLWRSLPEKENGGCNKFKNLQDLRCFSNLASSESIKVRHSQVGSGSYNFNRFPLKIDPKLYQSGSELGNKRPGEKNIISYPYLTHIYSSRSEDHALHFMCSLFKVCVSPQNENSTSTGVFYLMLCLQQKTVYSKHLIKKSMNKWTLFNLLTFLISDLTKR